MPCTPQKFKRLVKFIAAVYFIVAVEDIDEGVILKQTYSILPVITVNLIVKLDSKNLNSLLSTQRQSIDLPGRANVNNIGDQFEVGNTD